MSYVNRISLSVLMLLCVGNLYAAKPQLSVALNTSTVIVGTPLHLTLTVKGAGIQSVSFTLSDRTFSAFDLTKFIDTVLAESDSKTFVHQIIFTSVKAGDFKLNDLKAIVIYISGSPDTLNAKPIKVKFTKEIVSGGLNEIKPIASPSVAVSNMSLVVIFLLAAIASFGLVFYFRTRKKQPLEKEDIAGIYIQKIEHLQTAEAGKGTSADKAYNILTDFLNHIANKDVEEDLPHELPEAFLAKLRDDDREALKTIIDFSDKLRFGSPAISAGTVDTFLHDVKQFISNFNSLNSTGLHG